MSDDLTQKVDILGLFYGRYNTAPGEEDPKTSLTINKSALTELGASGTFIGRFAWQNTGANTETIETKVTVDGVPVSKNDAGAGERLTTQGQNGIVDAPVLDYPNSAKLRAPGTHVIGVTVGVRRGVFGGQHTFGVGFPSTEWFPEKKFFLTLVDA